MNWVETLNGAIDYIEDNLLNEISLSQIARQVYTSSTHLQRGFSALAGLTMSEYIRNRRLSLAGVELTHKDVNVINVAIKYGYETSESFSKAFSRFHGIAPSVARQYSTDLKSYSRLTIKIIMEGGSVMDYRIEAKEEFEVVVKVKTIQKEEGDSTEIPAFWDEYSKLGMSGETIGICGKVDEAANKFPYGIGFFKKDGQEVPKDFEVWQVPKNTWAVFRGNASSDDCQAMWNKIYSEWLPHGKYEILESSDFELWNDDYFEIWLPVKKK